MFDPRPVQLNDCDTVAQTMPIVELIFAETNVDTPPNRVRRRHSRSKAGCDSCKRRRVKCDERTPTCGTCARRGVKCNRRERATEHTNDKRSFVDSLHGVYHSFDDNNKQLVPQLPRFNIEMVPLRLLHHYENLTLETLVLGPLVWKKVLNLAFEVVHFCLRVISC